MDLNEYNEKRDFKKTSEPEGKLKEAEGNIFVVQEHFASHRHFDFRLELNGTLKSWAVPKGPSLDPKTKRLAVHVEDHPVDYATFEGVIPQGEYGGGKVILWDYGSWEPIKDPNEGYKKGKIEFVLKGEKLKGKWALIKTSMGKKEDSKKSSSKHWLLMKMKDDEARKENIAETRPESVKNIVDQKSEKTEKRIPDVQPQLATTKKRPPQGSNFIREVKFDGYRTMAKVEGGTVTLFSRNGKDWSNKYPVIRNELRKAPINEVLLDGEIVYLSKDGITSFGGLQKALRSGDHENVYFYAFDILSLEGKDLSNEPQTKRKEVLEDFLASLESPKILYSDHFDEEGEVFFANVCEMGLEGMISKEKNAPYSQNRNENWIKTKCIKTEPFAVIGYTKTKGANTVGALLVARKNESGAFEVGKVGTGFSQADRRDFIENLQLSEKPKNIPIPANYMKEDILYVEPNSIVQIKFTEITAENKLRHPVYEGIREDLGPEQILSPWDQSDALENIITSPEKELWPGISKKDLGRYLLKVESLISPYLYNRLLTLIKCPKGIGGDCFYSKHPGNMKGLETAKIEKDGKTEEYIYIKDGKALATLARYNALELHTWNTKANSPDTPVEMVIDLDPAEGMPQEDLIEASLLIREVLDSLELPSFPKVTGGKGLHLHVPLAPIYSVERIYQFSKSIAYILEEEAPDLFTSNSRKKERKGKIFVDYLRNGFGATYVSPYSPRAKEGAPLALPLSWKDLEKAKKLPKTTLKEALEDPSVFAENPWENYWDSSTKINLFEEDT